jgi:SAM-dependent methyltransferase
VAAYYSRTLAAHGPSARGVDWKDEASQHLRHSQFLRLLGEDVEASIADLGCGYGSFLDFIRKHRYRGTYTGYDVAADMITAAENLHGTGSDRRWVTGSSPIAPADYVIASGIFNVKQGFPDDVWEVHLDRTMHEMASAARRGWGFNVLSTHSDPGRRRADLYYADPAALLDRLGRRYGRSIALLQDYGLYEFTVLVRRSS